MPFLLIYVLHAGGKFDNNAYKVSGGLHGVGASVVNALSEHAEVMVKRDGKMYEIKFSRGDVVQPLQVIGESETTGSTTRFKADSDIFTETTVYEFDILANRVRELAYLNRGLSITIQDEREGEEQKKTFHYEGGIKSYVEHLNAKKEPIHESIFVEAEREGIAIEIAMQYNSGYNAAIFSFANNINTYEGGTHESGFKTALTRVINDYARKNNLLKESETVF